MMEVEETSVVPPEEIVPPAQDLPPTYNQVTTGSVPDPSILPVANGSGSPSVTPLTPSSSGENPKTNGNSTPSTPTSLPPVIAKFPPKVFEKPPDEFTITDRLGKGYVNYRKLLRSAYF
jgi:hypothetical protein